MEKKPHTQFLEQMAQNTADLPEGTVAVVVIRAPDGRFTTSALPIDYFVVFGLLKVAQEVAEEEFRNLQIARRKESMDQEVMMGTGPMKGKVN